MHRTNVRKHIEDKHPNETQPAVIHIEQITPKSVSDSKMADLRETLTLRKHDSSPTVRVLKGNNVSTPKPISNPTLILPYNIPPCDIQCTIADKAAQPPASTGHKHNRALLPTPVGPHDSPKPLDEYIPESLPGTPKSTATYTPTPRHHAPAGQYYTPPRNQHAKPPNHPPRGTSTYHQTHHRPTQPYTPGNHTHQTTPPSRTHSRTPVFTPSTPHHPQHNMFQDIQRSIDQRFDQMRSEMRSLMQEFCQNMNKGSQEKGPTKHHKHD